MRRVLGFVTAGLLFAGVAAGAPALDPRDGVVLPARTALQVLKQCSRPAPSGAQSIWVPDRLQIRDLEARLPGALVAALGKTGTGKQATDYVRQYAGFMIRGRRIIYVNGMLRRAVDNETLPPQLRTDWRHEPVTICGGGALFFGVEYDLMTKTFVHFALNGAE